MKAILLDGSQATDQTGERIRTALLGEFQAQGWDVENITLCESKIGNCAGDFFCWIRTPGVCNVNDDNRIIAEALANSDLMIYFSPITFGGYSPTLKGMVDHQIQNVSPFFARVAGETHHAKRYQKNPDFLAVGWLDTPDAHAEGVFRHLVQRNAINWHCKKHMCGVAYASQSDAELQAAAHKWLHELHNGHSSPQVGLPTNGVSSMTRPIEIQRALLLVGSPKTRKSTSNSLGGYLFEQLVAQDIQTETIYLHTVLRNPQKLQALLDAVEAADLVALAFPIYVDALPAPVVEALECIAAHRQGCSPSKPQLFTAIANCGFPEAYQCDTALAICETFAIQAGFKWAGSLALGAGQMLNGIPLAEGGGMTLRMRQSLELAAQGLVEQSAIPEAARQGLAKPVVPKYLYWLMGWSRWNQEAKGYDAKKLLKRQPYLAKAK